MDKWEQERQERLEAERKAAANFGLYCAEIADRLNELDTVKDWKVLPVKNQDGFWSRHRTICSESAQEAISIHPCEKNRVSISGDYDGPKQDWGGYNHTPYNAEKPSATVAIERGAYTVAKEIGRRVLPGYRALLPRVKASKAEAIRRENAAEANADKLAAAIGTFRREIQGKKERLFYVKNLNGVDYMAHFQVEDGGRVKIEMTTTCDAAIQIINALGFHDDEQHECKFCGRVLLRSEIADIKTHQSGASDCPSITDYKGGDWYEEKN